MKKSRKVIVYFHGYGSSPNSDKVDRLKSTGAEVYSYSINVDPRIAIPELEDSIDMMLLDDLHSDLDLTFVGTSLGGWYAGVLGAKYACRRVLINPCIDPKNMLGKYNVATEVLSYYEPLELVKDTEYHIALNDGLIDFSPYMTEFKSLNTKFYKAAGHRFNGVEFTELVDAL